MSFAPQLVPVDAELQTLAEGAQALSRVLDLDPFGLRGRYEPSDRAATSGDEHLVSLGNLVQQGVQVRLSLDGADLDYVVCTGPGVVRTMSCGPGQCSGAVRSTM